MPETPRRPFQVLVLCTANSARSILAEALITHHGMGRVRGFSAGSHPRGVPNPAALAHLAARGIATDGLASKGWEAFATPDAPRMDLVVTVCDAAAGETCPVWPGAPATAHWGIPDPAAATGDAAQVAAAFERAAARLLLRIGPLLGLADAIWRDPAALQAAARRIGAEAAADETSQAA
ncbi:MAG: arsenate reductase ArsC [Alphaproteobacteria bacterium]|nr:arsenate reductase ArsC [Alphaproteobacteria bacterium]